MHLGSTVWINGTLLSKTHSVIPGLLTILSLAVGLLLSKPILIHITTLKVYLFSAMISALAFYLTIFAEKLWVVSIFSLIMGYFTGVAFFAPVVQS